jgi:uncharacterized membrane protein
MTAEERVSALHERVNAKKRAREMMKTAVVGVLSAVLSICLILLIFAGGAHSGSSAGMYSGATMLFGEAGGYVLAAVAAFMAGVIVTVLIIRKRKRDRQKEEEEVSDKEGKDEK